MNITPQALIYCRVSSRQQLDGGGLGSQEQRCLEYAKTKGYKVIATFKDSYSGGGDFMNRPAMRELLAYVDEYQQPYVVIFDDLKRFARDVKFHWELRAEFQIRDLTPECLNFTFEETPEGNFIETIIAAQGELERQQNKRQTIQKMKARMARGLFCFTRPPLGYRYVKSSVYGGHVLEIEPKDATVIKEAFTAFAMGKFYHIKEVAEYITANKHKCKGQVVKYHTARNMLSNIVYAGYLEYSIWNIQRTKGVHEPIISLDIYQKIQERLHKRLPQRTRKDFSHDFPLRGFINCIFCNRPFTASWSKSRTGELHPYYRCATPSCEFKGKSIAQRSVHEHFLEYIRTFTPNETVMKLIKLFILKEITCHEKIQTIEQQKNIQLINSIDIEIVGLVKMIASNVNSPLIKIYEEQLLKLQNKKIVLEAHIVKKEPLDIKKFEPLVDKAFKPFKSPYITWLQGNSEKRKILQKILLSDNLLYSKSDGFRTSQKLKIYSLFGKIDTKFVEKSSMRTKSKKVRTNPERMEIFEALLQEIERCAKLADELENIE
ncbi:MAG: recombinase family protein [Chitinophagales bacterium]|nr:recombinase family protein [Chitinophagales bacterium]